MLFKSKNLVIEEKKLDEVNYLYFNFKGKFTEEVSVNSCKKWSKKLNLSLEKYVQVWNCLEMDDFEFNAKNEWLNTLKLTKGKISKIIVISDKIMIRGAARLMLKLMSFESEIVRSENSLPWK